MFSLRHIATILLVPVLFSPSATAQTRSDDGQRTIKVSYSDLNVASVQGRAKLQQRVNHAISTVCDVGSSRDLGEQMAAAACRKSATAEGARQVAALTANTQMAHHTLEIPATAR